MDDVLIRLDCKGDRDWLRKAAKAVQQQGCCVVDRVLDGALIDEIRPAMYRVQDRILAEVGSSRLARAGELGVLRLMLKFDPVFFRLLAVPEVLALLDVILTPTALLHLQNGFILPSLPRTKTPSIFQNSYHRDFPRHLNGYVASLNTFFAIDEFTQSNGATLVLPGSHQREATPLDSDIRAKAFPVECPEGSMLVFDSTLWHAAGLNTSGKDRLAINQQFTRSWIKQQIDYVRAIGVDTVQKQTARTQQLLGLYTRVVTSLDEYYRPEEERLYKRGQG